MINIDYEGLNQTKPKLNCVECKAVGFRFEFDFLVFSLKSLIVCSSSVEALLMTKYNTKNNNILCGSKKAMRACTGIQTNDYLFLKRED